MTDLPSAHVNMYRNNWLFRNKKESRLRLWNMVVQSTYYKNNLFQSKKKQRWKLAGKTWVLYKHTETRNWLKNALYYVKITNQLLL